jgi:flagellar biosynthesis/type III secretory pathway M-ring protein FliF/YscJ
MRDMVSTAILYDPSRGDRIEVAQMEFEDTELMAAADGMAVRTTIVEGIRVLFMGLALLGSIAVLFFIMRSMASTLDPSKISIKAEQEFERRQLAEEEQPEESERDVLVKKIIKTSAVNPEMAAKTLKTFFKE